MPPFLATAASSRVHLGVLPPGRRIDRYVTLRGLMDVRSPDPDARRAMCELLVLCFNAEEFRRLVADIDPALTHELPGETCSDATVINRGVDLLLRHARVDLNFFERWAQLRPARRSQIFLVAQEMVPLAPRTTAIGSTAPSFAAATPLEMAAPQATGQDLDFWAFMLLVSLVVVVVLLYLALRDDPFRVEYTIAAFLIGAAIVLALLRHDIAAFFTLVAGVFVLVWTGIRADRRAAIARA